MTWNTSEEVRKSKRLISVGDADQGNVRSFKYLGHVPSDNPKAPHYITQQISWFSVIKMGRNQIQSLQTMKSDCQHESGSWRGGEESLSVCSSNRDSQDGQPGQA